MPALNSDVYSKALVSYIDVLGFENLVNDTVLDPTKVSTIEIHLTTNQENLSAGARIHRDSNENVVKIFDSFNFSDLTVRSTRIPNGANIGDFVDWELFYLAANQLALATQSVLVRGGICIGDLFARSGKTMLFGPALIRAYKLESQYAVYPRIIIDRDLIREAENAGYIAEWQDYVQRGEDGAYFLDYLFGPTLTGLGFPSAEGPRPKDQIEAHRKMIQDVVAKEIHRKGERVKQKYLWLALYHNSAMKRLQRRLPSENFTPFAIPEHLLNF